MNTAWSWSIKAYSRTGCAVTVPTLPFAVLTLAKTGTEAFGTGDWYPLTISRPGFGAASLVKEYGLNHTKRIVRSHFSRVGLNPNTAPTLDAAAQISPLGSMTSPTKLPSKSS